MKKIIFGILFLAAVVVISGCTEVQKSGIGEIPWDGKGGREDPGNLPSTSCVEAYSLGESSSVVVGGHTVHVGTIFETRVEAWLNNGPRYFVEEDEAEFFEEEVLVLVEDIGYTEDIPSRRVLLVAGDTSCVSTYSLGQDESLAVREHTLHIGTIFENRVEAWLNNGPHYFVEEDEAEFFEDDVLFYIEDIGYTEDVESRRVIIVAG